VVVYHSYLGCDSGCCGHTVEVDGERRFRFEHPYAKDGDWHEWAKRLVEDAFGERHVADLNWEESVIVDD
jgi:hypothetical protein